MVRFRLAVLALLAAFAVLALPAAALGTESARSRVRAY